LRKEGMNRHTQVSTLLMLSENLHMRKNHDVGFGNLLTLVVLRVFGSRTFPFAPRSRPWTASSKQQ
jgi:hypothetical protein